MKHNLFDLVAKSTQEVFETMSFLDLVQGPPLDDHVEVPGIEITATICLGGEISGMLAIHCSRAFARTCATLISGLTEEWTDEHLCDTVGELANMVAGTLKRHLSTAIDLFDIALPSLIYSSGHRLCFKGARATFPRLLIPFSTENEEQFFVEMYYHKR